ncbi:MAG: arginine--tRNA ligase [Actinobacteria bacterium]|nr:arginine--tRNA ligase [Actinomycetota bacterium]
MARPEDLDPVLAELATRVTKALEAAGLPAADPEFERPRQPEHGDWATTVALRLAKPARRPPRDIAQAIIDHIELPEAVESVDLAGPGFVNFRLSHAYFEEVVRTVVAKGDAYGRRQRDAGQREMINIEFVSANPTGPLHVGAGRWAATGDALAELLAADGHGVVREYYVNDAGEQVRRFGESIVLVARGEELDDDHYRGEYIHDLAREIRLEFGEDFFTVGDGIHFPEDQPITGELSIRRVRERAADGPHDAAAEERVEPSLAAKIGEIGVRKMRDHIADVLRAMGVEFDVWFSERVMHDQGAVEQTIEDLRAKGETYEEDGALFLRTTTYGDDKDRVLVRSDGRPTYFAADCAYFRDKWNRDHTRLIYLLGADHHGYVGRLKAAARSLGIPQDRLEIRIGQLVNLLRGGEPVRMSKRAGELITLDEVVEEVGSDVTRYHFLRQSLDTTVDFDLDEVVKQSMENPVYYVQYAFARINSLIRLADERGFAHGELADADLGLLTAPAEQELVRKLAELPGVIADAAELRATQRLTRYAEELASSFHRFYTECRILPSDDLADDERAAAEELGRARYWLAVAAKQVLGNVLAILRVSAPERM